MLALHEPLTEIQLRYRRELLIKRAKLVQDYYIWQSWREIKKIILKRVEEIDRLLKNI